jgi:hypothetical protein
LLHLVVVFTLRRKLFRTVTAYEMNVAERKSMPQKSTDVPKFQTGPEEAIWYATPQGRRQTLREFARALQDGTLIRSTGGKTAKTDPKVLERLMEEAKRSATRSISIRV